MAQHAFHCSIKFAQSMVNYYNTELKLELVSWLAQVLCASNLMPMSCYNILTQSNGVKAFIPLLSSMYKTLSPHFTLGLGTGSIYLCVAEGFLQGQHSSLQDSQLCSSCVG